MTHDDLIAKLKGGLKYAAPAMLLMTAAAPAVAFEDHKGEYAEGEAEGEAEAEAAGYEHEGEAEAEAAGHEGEAEGEGEAEAEGA